MGFARSPLLWALAAQAALYLSALDAPPVWGDEQFTLNTIRLPWKEIPAALRIDIHPPLYYFALKSWMALPLPLEPIVQARAFSVCCALAATAVLDRLWLAGRGPGWRRLFLTLWVLSPALLLYARMARSYALQVLLAALALHLALGVRERFRPTTAVGFIGSTAALLYTHYLPGLAVLAAALLVIGVRRPHRALALGVTVLLAYAPWLSTLAEGVWRAVEREPYELSSGPLTEHFLRFSYWAVSFAAGEAHSWPTLCLTPAVLLASAWALWRSWFDLERPLRTILLITAAVGYLGAASWAAFVFIPARLLFCLPFFLLTLAAGLRDRWRAACVAALAFYGLAALQHFRQEGFLNKGYLVPYEAIAREIQRSSRPGERLVIADAFNADPKPLATALEDRIPLIQAESPDFVEQAHRFLAQRRPRVVWYARAARDISPARLHERLEEGLRAEFSTKTRYYLPYASWERWALRRITGEAPPAFYFQVTRFERKD